MTQEQLYKAFVASGLNNMSWAKFSGLAIGCSTINYNDNMSQPRAGYGGVGAHAPVVTENSSTSSYEWLSIATYGW